MFPLPRYRPHKSDLHGISDSFLTEIRIVVDVFSLST